MYLEYNQNAQRGKKSECQNMREVIIVKSLSIQYEKVSLFHINDSEHLERFIDESKNACSLQKLLLFSSIF